MAFRNHVDTNGAIAGFIFLGILFALIFLGIKGFLRDIFGPRK